MRNESSFFRTNNTGVTHGDTLGLMKPFLISLLAAPSIPTILLVPFYTRGIDIRWTSLSVAIEKLISYSGGIRESSSRKISRNSLTTRIDCKVSGSRSTS